MAPEDTKSNDFPKQGLLIVIVACAVMVLLGGGLSRCGSKDLEDGPPPSMRETEPEPQTRAQTEEADTEETDTEENGTEGNGNSPRATATTTVPPTGEIAEPDSLEVLVDRERFFAEDHVPDDLVEAAVTWAPSDDDDRRKLREPAAEALAELFDAAEDDGRPLLGVSAYRSYDTQKQVHEHSLEEDENGSGALFSAEPGHSEHQSGLAVDVTGADGVCTLEPCFAATPSAHWLASNAHRFGFIIRYPADKQSITEYAHEPWHLRYVGPDLAEELHESGLTLDEHLGVDR